MLDENPSLYYQWWDTLRQLDVPKIQQMANIHPHLIWTTTTESSFLSSCGDTIQQSFDRDLGSSLGALNTIHWLILNYQLDNAKTMVTFILNMVDSKDLNDNAYWGDRENTIMHLVSVLGYDDLALQLGEKGVHANVPNSHGRLPHHVAQSDTMVELLLNIKDNNTLLSQQQISDNSDGLSSSTWCETDSAQDQYQQPQQQQAQQLIKPSSSLSSPPNMEQPPTPTPSHSTLRKYGKDDHYFRPGQVEETKQKVLGDEQVELEKQRERRRKDIALLAQRSAVKNNPFVKKSDATTLDADPSTLSSTHNDPLTSNAAILRIQANDLPPGERKCKRNSKGINSLQTKSYVSSSIFRQGQPPHGSSVGGAKQHLLASQQQQRLKKESIDKFDDATTNSPDAENDNEQAMAPSLSDASSVVVMDPWDLSTNKTATTLSTTSMTPLAKDTNESDNDSDNDSKSDQSMMSALSSTDHGFQDSDSSLAVSENNEQSSPLPPPPSSSSASDTTGLKCFLLSSSSSSPSLSLSPSKDSNTNTPTKILNTRGKVEQSSKIQLEVNKPAKFTRNDMLIRDHVADTKRQSGSQKSHWSKELTSWVTILNREFSLNVDDDDHQDHNGNTTSIDDLTLALENASKFGGGDNMESGPTTTTTLDKANHGDARRDDAKQQQQHHFPKLGIDDNNINNGVGEIHHQQDVGTSDIDDEDEYRRRGLDVLLRQGSEHLPKLYGSVSGRRPAAIYAKKRPPFDFMNMAKTDGADHSTPPPVRNKNTFELSPSASSPSPSTSNTADSHHHHHHHQRHHQHQQQGQSLSSTTNLTANLCDRGKLYVRVNSVNDILLPLPRDRAHVRCVIGDGRYEYMSRYEALGQNIQFGFECIIDSHPDMIITLSLHVRPDYMLKKPLKRLFSSNRKRKGSLSAYVSDEDGAVGQTRFAIGDMIGACYKQPYAGCFYCFNAWHIHSAKDKTSAATTSSSSASVTSSSSSSASSVSSFMTHQQQELDQGVLKVIGNFKVQLLYLPVLNPSSPVPRNLHECDMAIKAQL